jgi:hypothetical protein
LANSEYDLMTMRPVRRFRLGFTWAVLAWATLNAGSYFFWSDGWGNLLGTQPGCTEAIGFPWVIWEQGQTYSGHVCHVPALVGDALLAIGLGVVAGLATARHSRRSQDEDHDETPTDTAAHRSPRQNQFSLRTLLLVTALAAMFLAVVRSAITARPVLLGLVYFLGPAVVVLVCFSLRRVVPRHRNLVAAVATLLLIVAAAILGETIGTINDFTKGIFGTFVFWIPQCTLIALLAAMRGVRSPE